MSKDIKVGDWVRATSGVYFGAEFPVERVKKSDKDLGFGKRYVVNDKFAALGVWFKHLEKIENPNAKPAVDVAVGDWVQINEKCGRDVGEIFQITEVCVEPSGSYYVNGDKAGGGVWRNYIDKIDAPKSSRTAYDIVNGYRKELLSNFNTVSNEARPIRQAKLTAVGEILDRLRDLG